MDSKQVKGLAHELKGSVKEGIGNLTGDTKLQVEGKAEKAAGKAEKNLGKAHSVLKDELK